MSNYGVVLGVYQENNIIDIYSEDSGEVARFRCAEGIGDLKPFDSISFDELLTLSSDDLQDIHNIEVLERSNYTAVDTIIDNTVSEGGIHIERVRKDKIGSAIEVSSPAFGKETEWYECSDYMRAQLEVLYEQRKVRCIYTAPTVRGESMHNHRYVIAVELQGCDRILFAEAEEDYPTLPPILEDDHPNASTDPGTQFVEIPMSLYKSLEDYLQSTDAVKVDDLVKSVLEEYLEDKLSYPVQDGRNETVDELNRLAAELRIE